MTKATRRSARTAPWALAGIVVLALWAWTMLGTRPADTSTTTSTADTRHVEAPAPAGDMPAPGPTALPAWLPPEAHATLRLIARGGPFPYRQDGAVFGNRERLLPAQPRGWYREYTVDTPGSDDRGARRIVSGGDPPVELYYSADHYRSFRRIPVVGTSR